MSWQALELERQHISEQMREQQQQVQKQLEDNEKERRRAEGKLRKALAAETTAHGHDLDLLEGGLLQRMQVTQSHACICAKSQVSRRCLPRLCAFRHSLLLCTDNTTPCMIL